MHVMMMQLNKGHITSHRCKNPAKLISSLHDHTQYRSSVDNHVRMLISEAHPCIPGISHAWMHNLHWDIRGRILVPPVPYECYIIRR